MQALPRVVAPEALPGSGLARLHVLDGGVAACDVRSMVAAIRSE
jgi:hypothetical protein